MTKLFNKKSEQEKRRSLRNNMSNAEKVIWNKLRNKQVLSTRFIRQFSVDKYVIDFYCQKLKLVIEIDGDSHFIDYEKKYEKQRQNFIESYGITFLRFTNNEIYESLNSVINVIEKKIKELNPLPPLKRKGGNDWEEKGF